MRMRFTVVDLDGKEHTSEPVDGIKMWDHVIYHCAVVYANEVALKHGPVKIKSIERTDLA